MGNLFDYIDWRGDLSFDREPFNDIDALLLSEIVYTEVGGIVPGGVINDKVRFDEVIKSYFGLYDMPETIPYNSATGCAPYLWEKAAESVRFKDIKVTGYLNFIDNTSHTQFAVLSFFLPDGTVFVAFRGTDDSITGWREDFNMSYMKETAGQTNAIKYIRKFYGHSKRRIRLGGHSKGGNFAIFAAMKAKEELKDRIISVYAFDSPGFNKRITSGSDYKEVIKKVKSYVPEQSVVSLFFDSALEDKVVKSTGTAIGQHNPITWQILGRDFEYAEGLCNDSMLIDRAFNDWLAERDSASRELFINTAFDILETNGNFTLDDLFGNGVSLRETARIINDLSFEEQQVIKDAFKTFATASGGTIKESFITKIKPLEALYKSLFR